MREYTITSQGAPSGTTTLIYIQASSAPAPNIECLRWWAGFGGTATSSQQRIQIRITSGYPSTTAVTPIKLKESDAASNIVGSTAPKSGQCGVNATVETVTNTTVYEDAFNVLNGWLYVPTPPEVRVQPAGAISGLTLYFPVAPSITTSWSWGLNYREV